MNKLLTRYFLFASIVVFSACTSNDKKATTLSDTIAKDTVYSGDNSHVSLDWEGTYEGVLPCADCPGIVTVLTLKGDNTFTMYNSYKERNTEINDKGKFTWDATGSIIHVKGTSTDVKYKVGENQLIQLDLEGNALEGPLKDAFNLTKHSSAH